MYKLLIKKKDSNTWHIADFGKDAPAITFSTHDITTLDNRQSNYSQRLKLPLTQNNKRIFDFVNSTSYNGNIYKKFLDARLYCNGNELLGVGGILKIVGIQENEIEVCLLSQAKDFYTQLESIDFDNSDILGTPRLPTKSFTEGESQVSDDTDFIFVQYRNGDGSHLNIEQKNGFIQFACPMLRICHKNKVGLLPRLCRELGYELETNLQLDNDCLSLIDRKTKNEIEECYRTELMSVSYSGDKSGNVEATKSIRDDILKSKHIILFVVNAFVGDDKHIYTYFRVERATGDSYPPTITFTNYNGFEADGWQQDPNDESRYIKQFAYDTETKKSYISDKYGNFVYNKTHTDVALDLSNIKIAMSFSLKNNAITLQGNIDLKTYFVYSTQGDGVAIAGSTINVAKSLGWANGRDALNNLCNIYGAITRVDKLNKKFYFFSFDKIKENKSKARDWSDKLIKGVEQTFVIGQYAKKNNITLQENTKDGNVSKAFFSIDNETISEHKDVLNLPLESPYKIDRRYIYQTDGLDFVPNKSPTLARIVKDSQYGYYYVDTTYGATDIVGLYRGYADMLNNSFVIDAKFILLPTDVADFDFFRPIYLKQYGRYFFVNDIKNFVENKPTEVTLIAI